MKELFTNLGFEVGIYEDQGAQDMRNLISEFACKDHSNSCAAVCVIMSHGRLGQIYGTDYDPESNEKKKTVPIIEMAERLSKCKSLQGKPKMFFIHACQTGYSKSYCNCKL